MIITAKRILANAWRLHAVHQFGNATGYVRWSPTLWAAVLYPRWLLKLKRDKTLVILKDKFLNDNPRWLDVRNQTEECQNDNGATDQ